MNYQPTSIGTMYSGVPYPGNMFTPWGKPNWSYMSMMGGIHMNTTGGSRGTLYGGPSFGGPPSGGLPSVGPPYG